MTQEETDEEWERKFQNALFRHEKYLDMIDWNDQFQREKALACLFLEGVSLAADAAKDMVLEAFKEGREKK